MSTPKSSKNQQPPYSKDENKSVIRCLPSQLFQQNILKASHPVASKQITTSFYSFFLLQSAWKTPASFSHNPSGYQKEQLQFTHFHESQYNYQDEIPANLVWQAEKPLDAVKFPILTVVLKRTT